MILEERVKRLNYVIRGWINYFKLCYMKMVMNEITSHLNRRVRCVIWKQWKNPKTRFNNLKKLGVATNKAKIIAYTRKSYWNISKSLQIHVVISNKNLKLKGLVFSIDHYLKVHTA